MLPRGRSGLPPREDARGLPPPGAAPAGRLPPFDHGTGEGHVPFHGGDYYDARFNKRNQVVPLIVEALGGR